ncbi:extracellular protein [Secundilactobacillus odoratitofui DSM 19909 = JCM 15043]|uniref:Extracellular protein n=2 Tax=Secundilactobacillus odoratitofui TaxID=480930 RepID=A0A0R1LTC0_9LACO|nr:Ig-like domain-containing protein [Secundilactobacillus odoratitofui]KRK98909.1 extracellular protein [Secundilactobacillus odoratitofui DSM 19909 = JCM 15043]
MKKLAVLTASLIAAFSLMGLGVVNQTKASASTTVAAGSPSLSVNKIYTTTTKVTGKATKGVKVIVESSKKKALASATASKTTGAYSVKLPAKQKAGTKLYVYAKNTKTGRYFYRIITVQKKTTTTSTKKTTTSKTTKSSSSSKKSTSASFKVSTPTGTWNSTSSKGYKMKFVFSQKTGLNEYVIKGKKTAHVLKNATYSVTPKTTTFWKINVKAKDGKKSTFYMRFTAKNKFVLVNSKNQKIKTSVGKAPAAYYTFKLA